MKKEEETTQEEKQKTTREEKPIKARYLIAAGATIIFMIGSMMMVRVSEKNFPVNIPARQLNQPEFSQMLSEENELTIEGAKNETEAWMEKFIASQPELVSDLKGIDVSELGPDEAYLAIRKEFEKVKEMGDFMAFIEIYGSDKNIKSLQQIRMIASLISDDTVIEAVKAHFAEDIKSAEIITSSKEKAVIKVISETGREGEVTMVFERGSWKFDAEKW